MSRCSRCFKLSSVQFSQEVSHRDSESTLLSSSSNHNRQSVHSTDPSSRCNFKSRESAKYKEDRRMSDLEKRWNALEQNCE